MRDRETIDSELRRLAAERRLLGEHGGEVSSRELDRLLDERLGHRPEAVKVDAADILSPRGKADGGAPHRRRSVLFRFGLRAAIPLSVVSIAAVLVVTFVVHRPQPTAEPKVVPQSDELPNVAAPKPPAAPVNHAPQLAIVDKALVDAMQHEGVPIPSNEYVAAHGHAVCDFLAHQPNFAAAVNSVQQSSIWDADQSADVAAGAVISYCPQYETVKSGETQQAFQKSLSTLQDIQGDLQGINNGVKGIEGDLHGIQDGLQPGG
jgi:hypothetical protein